MVPTRRLTTAFFNFNRLLSPRLVSISPHSLVLQHRSYAHECNLPPPNDYYYQKYKEKLQQKATAEGVATVEELLKQKKDAAKQTTMQERRPFKEESNPVLPNASAADSPPNARLESDKDMLSHSSRKDAPPTSSRLKSLSQILHLDKLKSDGASADDIGKIWTSFHSAKPNLLSAVIPTEVYSVIAARAREYPIFVLPVPGPDGIGFELHLLQWSFHTCMFTSLAEYKSVGPEAARPYLALTHYTELAKEKGIVLMRGEITEGNDGSSAAGLISMQHAQLLAMLLQDFYGVTGGERKRELLEQFHKAPNEFSVDRLVECANTMGRI